MYLLGKNVCSWFNGSSNRSFMVGPLSYFSFQPVLLDWCNKGHDMFSRSCGIVHIKEPLDSVAHVVAVYVQRHITVNTNLLSVSLNKIFPSVLPGRSALISNIILYLPVHMFPSQ